MAAARGARCSLPPTSRRVPPLRAPFPPLPSLRSCLRRMQECGLPVDLSTARTSANVTPCETRRPSVSVRLPAVCDVHGRADCREDGPLSSPSPSIQCECEEQHHRRQFLMSHKIAGAGGKGTICSLGEGIPTGRLELPALALDRRHEAYLLSSSPTFSTPASAFPRNTSIVRG